MEENQNTQTNQLLAAAKLALRISGTDFDSEITMLIESGLLDLGLAGVLVPSEVTSIVTHAVITYVKMNFGQPDNYDQLKTSYDEQKSQLSTATGYTNWLNSEV